MPDLAPYSEPIKLGLYLLLGLLGVGTVWRVVRGWSTGIKAKEKLKDVGEAQQSQREHRDRIDAETEAGEDAFDRGAGRPRD